MKRLLIAATLALGVLVGSEMQVSAGGYGVGVGLKLNFDWGRTYPSVPCVPCGSGSSHPGYGGFGSPIPYDAYQGGGYPMAGYGGYDPSMSGMAPQGYAGYPNMGGQQAYNAAGGVNGMAYGQPAPVNGTNGGTQMPTSAPAVTAIAK